MNTSDPADEVWASISTPFASKAVIVTPLAAGDHQLTEVVRQNGNQNRGELDFGNPPEAGESTLDFEPLGATIEVYADDEVVLEVLFPEP